jgi:predicted secreted protein
MKRVSWVAATALLVLGLGLAGTSMSCSSESSPGELPAAKKAEPAPGREVIETAPVTPEEPKTPGAEEPKPFLVTDADAGKTIEVDPDMLIQVRLEGNPATGYVWSVKEIKGDAIREYGETGYERVPATRPGGPPGVFTIPLQARKPGESVVTLYAHPQGKTEPVQKTFTVTFECKAPPVIPTAEAMKTIQSDLTNVRITLQYQGDATNLKIRRLVIHGPAVKINVVSKFAREVAVPVEEMASALGALEADGFLTKATTDEKVLASGSQVFWLIVEGPTSAKVSLRQDLGWGSEMLKRMEALRAGLKGDAAKAMDELIGSLVDVSKSPAPAPTPAPTPAPASPEKTPTPPAAPVKGK